MVISNGWELHWACNDNFRLKKDDTMISFSGLTDLVRMYAELHDEKSELQKTLAQTKQELAHEMTNLRAIVHELRDEKSDMHSKLVAMQTHYAQARDECSELRRGIAVAENALATMRAELAVLEIKNKALSEQLASTPALRLTTDECLQSVMVEVSTLYGKLAQARTECRVAASTEENRKSGLKE